MDAKLIWTIAADRRVATSFAGPTSEAVPL